MGFWAGVTAPLFGMMVVNGIIFGVEGQAMRYMPDTNNRKDLVFQHACAGALAGGTQSVVASPTEMIKCRMQVQRMQGGGVKYKNVFDGIWKVWKAQGMRAVMSGFTITLGSVSDIVV